jgi:integrase
MPLSVKRRGSKWHIYGRIEHDGQPITDYIRRSSGASTEAGARRIAEEWTKREIRRHILGEEKAGLTFDEAVMLYQAKPADAGFLLKVLPHLTGRYVNTITPQEVRNLGRTNYPNASTDTWTRQVVAPIRAVINNAHDLGKCPPIKVRAYTGQERLDQDRRRQKESRQERHPATWEWVQAFIEHADPYNAAMVDFMFQTGARINQAIALTPHDVDLINCRVRLRGNKGHDEQWVQISNSLRIRLANLPAKRPHNRATGERGAPRVFGYATRTGPRKAWATACDKAGIALLTPHSMRHGFFTHLTTRLGIDDRTAAEAGRWKDPNLPRRIYQHSGADEADIRAIFDTNPAQSDIIDVTKHLKAKQKKG